jgi:hypothetical protein
MGDKKPPKKPTKDSSGEFSGRVESITAGAEFRFEVAGKKLGRRVYAVPQGQAVASAYVAGKKIFVTGAPNGGGAHGVSEIRMGAKPVQIKAAKPAKPPKAPEPPAPAPAE